MSCVDPVELGTRDWSNLRKSEKVLKSNYRDESSGKELVAYTVPNQQIPSLDKYEYLVVNENEVCACWVGGQIKDILSSGAYKLKTRVGVQLSWISIVPKWVCYGVPCGIVKTSDGVELGFNGNLSFYVNKALAREFLLTYGQAGMQVTMESVVKSIREKVQSQSILEIIMKIPFENFSKNPTLVSTTISSRLKGILSKSGIELLHFDIKSYILCKEKKLVKVLKG